MWRVSRDRTAPFDDDDVAPDAVHLPELLLRADDAESALLVQRKARFVLREDAGLDRPDALGLGALDEPLEEQAPDPASLPLVVHINAVLDDAAVAGPQRHRMRCGPADHSPALDGHPALAVELRAVPCLPRGSLGLERRVPAGDALLEDLQHRRPVLLLQLPYLHVWPDTRDSPLCLALQVAAPITRRSRARTRPDAAGARPRRPRSPASTRSRCGSTPPRRRRPRSGTRGPTRARREPPRATPAPARPGRDPLRTGRSRRARRAPAPSGCRRSRPSALPRTRGTGSRRRPGTGTPRAWPSASPSTSGSGCTPNGCAASTRG